MWLRRRRRADAGAAERAAVSYAQSFTPSTKVLLASGAAVPIASLKPGDMVLATNTKTGKTQAEPVTAVMVHHDTDLYNLTIKDGHRIAVIHTTRNHLFWDQTTRRWTKAAALHRGDHLRTPAGNIVTIMIGHDPVAASGTMWDLTITTDHDFYIVVAAIAVLVHNCPTADDGYRTPGGNQAQNKMFRDAVREGQRQLGRQLNKTEIQRVHYEISGQGYGYHDIVDIILEMYG